MNNGLELEKDFISFFDGKTINQFNGKWQKHLRRMFPGIKDDEIIYAKKYKDDYAKPDIVVWTKQKRRLLGIKTGTNPSMHNEGFHHFYMFLKSIGLTPQALNIITLYHFGYSNKYGHKEKPLTKDEIVERYNEEIRDTNRELNDPVIIEQIVDRCVIKGAKEERESIDFLYYGNLQKGLLISSKQIKDSILSRKSIATDWIQFGELVYSPAQRSGDSKKRFFMRMTWPILSKLFYECKNEDDILSRPSLVKQSDQKPSDKPKTIWEKLFG